MAAAVDPNQLPVPILIVSHTGDVAGNEAFEAVLGRHELLDQLSRRFEVSPIGGQPLESRDLPWERVLREDFVEEQVWHDRVAATRFTFCVRGRARPDGSVLVLEDLTHHTTRLVRFADAAAVSALEPSLEDAGARLARGVEALSGANAVFVFLTAPQGLRLLASSRREITPEPLTAAIAASHTRTHREIPMIDSPEVTCPATRALLKSGLHSLAAFPLHVGPQNVGALVVAWHHATTLQAAERKALDAVSQACASALVHLQTLRDLRDEAALLRRQVEEVQESQHELAALHDELAVGIAHDMRTPVSSILLQIDLLLERGEQRGDHIIVPIVALGRVRDAAIRISRMVDDLFDASRIELRQIALDPQRMSLRDALTNLVAQLEPALNRTIELDARVDLPPVLADPERLDEIFTNLLENAAKYSHPGRPIAVRVEPDGVGVIVTVEDEGSGILAEELPRVFDRFYQAKTTRRKKSGLGLGLYITKGLVEAHGGRIWVESRAGQGTRFHVWLPSADRASDDVAAPAP